MKHNIAALSLLLFLVLLGACKQPDTNWRSENLPATYLHRAMGNLTRIMVHDIFSPPVATRIYAYPSIAAYEVIRLKTGQHNSLAHQLNGLETLPEPPKDVEICYELAAVVAFNQVGRALVFSVDSMDVFNAKIKGEMGANLPGEVVTASVGFGEKMAKSILEWADKDQYKQTRSEPKFDVSDRPGIWQPTPPDYMDAIEPHWRKIRTFVLDSAQQFKPAPPTTFSTDKNSLFFKQAMEVYDAVKNASPEHSDIAKFWDCNPYVSTHRGHFMFASKKITPGGHWIGITTLASELRRESFVDAAVTYALVSTTMADAFISCWDEKYRSKLIRPVTVIHKYIDENWEPLLQTPPFPEHTSGHSVVSGAAATALTARFGDAFAFTDTVEVPYGLPERKFSSFFQASDEAAISRLYGGIHYMPAITEGVKQGRAVGKFVVENLKFDNK